MKDMIDNAGGGSLRIMSRGGVCNYEYKKDIQRFSSPYSVGGTLIEWVINLPLKDLEYEQ